MVDRPTRAGFDPSTGQAATSSAPARPGEGSPDARPDARIVVNGEARVVPAGLALPDLLHQLGLRPGSVVVELRGVALTPSELPAVRLADGDSLEIVRAVAGG